MEFGSLNEVLLRLTKELEIKERELEALISEVQKLKAQARTLEDARALLIEKTPSARAYEVKSRIVAPVSLKDEIAKCLEGIRDGGLSVVEIASKLRSQKYPNSESRSFYASVFGTLARLEKQGSVVKFPAESGRSLFRLNRDELFEEGDREGGVE